MTVMWQVDLGRMAYEPVWALQHRLVERRIAGEGPDTLLYVEHDPVITLGRRADPVNILASPETLHAQGIHVLRIERGGDVTYHGPGQLVGYPIVHLPSLGLGASDWMHALEDALALALADLGIATHRREGVIGVWVGDNKIAALGVRIRRGVTFHGFALNVAPNMAHWSLIVPCGIRDGGVTSIAAELGIAPAMADVQQLVSQHFAEVLHVALEPHAPSELPPVTAADVV
ncbi:MAG: lipoyl(octanoyl) transferase LipB [Anaerolineales bacterium]